MAENIGAVGQAVLEAAGIAGKAAGATATVAEAVVDAAIAAETVVDIAIAAETVVDIAIAAEAGFVVGDDVLDVQGSHSLPHDLYKKQAWQMS